MRPQMWLIIGAATACTAGSTLALEPTEGPQPAAATAMHTRPSLRGTVRVAADPADSSIAPPYRFARPYTFEYTLRPRYAFRCCEVQVFDLTFPSPVTSDVPENNTVYAELFLPAGNGPHPAAIVLDIMQGNALVSRAKALWLAQHGVAGLVVHMAYYGPRRPADRPVRLISTDITRTLSGVRQTVLDIRCAAAWLASRPEFDPDNLGLVGTSLGSMIGTIAAANEPRLTNICLMLGGGGLVDAYADHPLAKRYFPWADAAISKNVLRTLLAPVDPLTYAPLLRDRRVLMVCAAQDDVVPPRAGRALWQAAGQPRIIWVEATHVGAAAYMLVMFEAMTDHLRGPPSAGQGSRR